MPSDSSAKEGSKVSSGRFVGFAPLEDRREERDDGRKGVVGRDGAWDRVFEVDRGTDERTTGVDIMNSSAAAVLNLFAQSTP